MAAARTFKGFYEIFGKGEPLLCLAGFGCSNWIFKDLVDHMPFQFILPDNRGTGRSPKPDSDYPLECLAEDALALMSELGFETYGVMGASMGGLVAQALTLKAPQRVSRLILLCTLGPGDAYLPLPALTEDDLVHLYSLDAKTMVHFTVRSAIHPSLEHRNPLLFKKIIENRLEHLVDLTQVLFQFRAFNIFLETAIPLHEIRCPTLILSGAQDRYVDPENSKILAKTIPHSELHFIDQADHLFFIEKKDEVRLKIESFLTRNRGKQMT